MVIISITTGKGWEKVVDVFLVDSTGAAAVGLHGGVCRMGTLVLLLGEHPQIKRLIMGDGLVDQLIEFSTNRSGGRKVRK